MGRPRSRQDRRRESDSRDAARQVHVGRGARVALAREGRVGGQEAASLEGVRLVRGAARGSGGRGGLQSASEPPARPVVGEGAGCRQARPLREAHRAHRRGSQGASGGKPACRWLARPGSVHGKDLPAVACCPRADPVGQDRRVARRSGFLFLLQPRPHERPQHGRHRWRRAPRHRLLPSHHLAVRFRERAEAGSRFSGIRPGSGCGPSDFRNSRFPAGPLDLHLRHPARPVPAHEFLWHAGAHRDQDPVQRPDDSPLPHLRR